MKIIDDTERDFIDCKDLIPDMIYQKYVDEVPTDLIYTLTDDKKYLFCFNNHKLYPIDECDTTFKEVYASLIIK